MQELRERTVLQWIINDQRYFVEVNQYDYVFYVHCAHNEAAGEGFTLEAAMEMFLKNWEDYNQYGPY